MIENIKNSGVAYACELGMLANTSKGAKEKAGWLNALLEENPHEAFKNAVVFILAKHESDDYLLTELCRVIGDCVEFGLVSRFHDKKVANAALKAVVDEKFSKVPPAVRKFAEAQLLRVNTTTPMLKAVTRAPITPFAPNKAADARAARKV